MTYIDRYNKISKHIFMLALLPQSPYKFRYTANLMSKGVMKASIEPVDEKLTHWPWFKAGVAVLKQSWLDAKNAASPDELHVSDDAKDMMLDGFKRFVTSLRRYVRRLERLLEPYRNDHSCPSVELVFHSAYAILKNIILPIDGGRLESAPELEEEDTFFGKRPIAELLFHDYPDTGISEYYPWSLIDLYNDCYLNCKLAQVPWGTLLDHRSALCDWYKSFFEEPDCGDDVRTMENYLATLEPYLPDISAEYWFKGYNPGTNILTDAVSLPAPVPPPPPAPKVEKNGMRFTVLEDTPKGATTYRDEIFETEYVISNNSQAKQIIDRDLVGDLRLGVKQWHPEWKKVKGSFQRDAGSRFNLDQIIHEPLLNLVGEKTAQFTGRWRIRTDAEMEDWMKQHKPAHSKVRGATA